MARPPGTTCPDCGAPVSDRGTRCPHCTETRDDSAPPTDAGLGGPKRIAGYRLLRELGAGGMGTVFEAYEERMHRRVALKVLSRHHAPSAKAGQRFEHEAWIGGKLDHPNLVKVYEQGDWNELSFYSMELVRGGSLHDVISNMRRWGRDDRLRLEFGGSDYVRWAITRVIEAARALDYAHRQGVVHRDVKPMNLLLSRELGTIKIADFGLAMDDEATRLTTAGKVLGTLTYMAPEQILGKRQEIDARTDIYALGVTLFELLTLDLPFTGQTQQLYMNAVLTSEPRRPSKLNGRVSRDLEVVVRKALEKDPRERYPSAAAFAEDLDNVLHFRPIRARPAGLPRRILKWARRKPIHAALAAVLIAGAPIVAILSERTIEHGRLVRERRLEELRNEIRLLSQRERHAQVVERASEILHLDPDDLRARKDRAVSYMRLASRSSDPATAADLVGKCENDLSRLIELRPETSWPHRLKAFVLRELVREAEAQEADEQARRYHSDQPSSEERSLDAYVAYETGDFARAVRLFSDVIADGLTSVDHLQRRAWAYQQLGQVEQAIQDYRLAVALKPDDFICHLNLGSFLSSIGSLDEGERYLRRAGTLDPDSAYVHRALSANLMRRGRQTASEGDREAALAQFRQAEQEARRTLKLDDSFVDSHLNLGASLMEQNRLRDQPDRALIEEAIEHYGFALTAGREGGAGENAGNYSLAMLNLCDARIQIRDLERAEEVCTEVARLRPDDLNSYYNLAGLYALTDRADEAFAALERDFELGDNDWQYVSRDSWFESLREDPRFTSLIDRMKARAAGS